eukprot:TRINITY_DN38657_c0_g1_i1.p1 TRINITY_DN38657_c0_g1~~TRINITY_DN38657_c0_g1_i1.p1  ORF type:complete len:200 (-),score=29.32 TRINITY_DN38657_c0_g1_i1:84-611(-)
MDSCAWQPSFQGSSGKPALLSTWATATTSFPLAPGCWKTPYEVPSAQPQATTPEDYKREKMIQKRKDRQTKQRAKKLALRTRGFAHSSGSSIISAEESEDSESKDEQQYDKTATDERWKHEPMYVVPTAVLNGHSKLGGPAYLMVNNCYHQAAQAAHSACQQTVPAPALAASDYM